MGAPLGISHNHIPIRAVLQKWWSVKPKNRVHKLLLHSIPVIICWEIWKSWNACRYGDRTSFSQYHMIKQCIWNIKAVINDSFPSIEINGNWINICDKIESLCPVIKCTTVYWKSPARGMIKLNTDGSSISTNGKAGIGGVVSNEQGDFIMGFSIPVNSSSNNHAKMEAASFGSNWCIQNGFTNIHIELDSLLITEMLIKKDTKNMKLKHMVKATSNTLRGANVIFTHSSNNGTSQAIPTCRRVYNVDTGDTCDNIIEFFNLKAEDFSSLNPNLNCDDLFLGEYLCLNGTLST
ncbi:uncharacterized protein LOC132038376 [Lycium ferocissimum]|uniref:uncharacterized protein LOC132038376 n=1 Tax=Lycium ferocissimum TaxID=112874 RepID=UPI00281559AD|nr:uncharacterized protein LOC132038376 [Lycium ferocissimum]